MTISGFLRSRSEMCKQVLFAKICQVQGVLWFPSLTSKASLSTDTQKFSTIANPSDRVFAQYTIYKGKACLSISPVLPTFTKSDLGRSMRVDRHGCVLLSFLPAIGPHKYDREKIQFFSLSATEIGSFLSMDPNDSCELFHDPSIKSSNAGQVQKCLSVKPFGDGSAGYFFSLTVVNNVQKTTERYVVPVTAAELAVMRSAFNFALPYILGWSAAISRSQTLECSKLEKPTGWRNSKSRGVEDSEWER